ncbi:MAG TPA: hypothetical protein VK609_22995, partial [Mucilaginibacter sp.]|nr:hypothetical protein [Mucilaginibacter sp.]
TIELSEPFIAGGLNYEIAHFCNLIKAGEIESLIISHQMSRQMIDLIDRARAEIGLKFLSEK